MTPRVGWQSVQADSPVDVLYFPRGHMSHISPSAEGVKASSQMH